MSAVEQRGAEPYFFARGGVLSQRVLRFIWLVDDATLKDVNRASGMDGVYVRGFLSRLITTWMDLLPEARPPFEVPTVLCEDLAYVPTPCYILAVSDDRSTMHCWYSVLVDAAASELLAGSAGVKLFVIEGDPELVSAYANGVLRLFRFRSKTRVEGFTFFRRF